MLFIHRLRIRISERIAQLRARVERVRETVKATAAEGAPWLGSWLLHILSRAEGEVRRHGPTLRARLTASLRPSELKRRAVLLQKWMNEHDTVPRAAIARHRERLIERRQRQEQRAIERDQRLEELAKKREKKEIEERQAYSVYFE